MESIRKIFTSLDFGGRCIKNVKIDDQPYYVPFNFNDDNKTKPVPQEVIQTIASMFSSTIDTDKLPVFYLYFGEVPIPQASVLIQCDVAGTDVETILFLSLADEIDEINASIVKSAKQLMIDGRDGSWELTELPFSSGGGGGGNNLFKIVDANSISYADIDGTWEGAQCIITYMSSNSYIGYCHSTGPGSILIRGWNLYHIDNKEIIIEGILIGLSSTGEKDINLVTYNNKPEIYILDLNNYTANVFNELSAMTLGTTIQVIDKSGRPCLYQIADHEPDYVTINSYMRYDDDDEDPEILSYTLRANGAIAGPTVRIRLETMGGGEKFLSDLGRYKEIKIPELINAKVTQAEYNAMESAGTLDNNTIYYIMG